jgi:predicted dehydrogenase
MFGLPWLIPASALGLNGAVAPGSRIVLGSIGVGNMGTGHVRALLRHADTRLVAVCDVRRSHRQRAKDRVDDYYGDAACSMYDDFRELLARGDIDAVVIAVPDHWHALIGLEAARRGKDMYYEKPMAMSVAEGQAVRRAVHRYGVIFQFGTQQRSSENYRLACELVRNGRIGRLETMMIGSAVPPHMPLQPSQPVPPGFDYEMWLGPAPWAPYTYERCTRDWTLIADYSLGCIGGAWGVHDVDIAQWANDSEATGPVEVEGSGVYPADSLYDTVRTWEVEHRYANGVKLIHMDMQTALGRAEQFKLAHRGTLFLGSEGWIYISRQGFFTKPDSLRTTVFGADEVRLPRSTDHRRNFLDAVKTREAPISGIDAAVRSDIVCHQAEIAMRLGRRLRWDPVHERFVDDEQANRMLTRAMRSPWHL